MQAAEGMLVEKVLLHSSPLPGAKALRQAAPEGRAGTVSSPSQSTEHTTGINKHCSLPPRGRIPKGLQVAMFLNAPGDEP